MKLNMANISSLNSDNEKDRNGTILQTFNNKNEYKYLCPATMNEAERNVVTILTVLNQ